MLIPALKMDQRWDTNVLPLKLITTFAGELLMTLKHLNIGKIALIHGRVTHIPLKKIDGIDRYKVKNKVEAKVHYPIPLNRQKAAKNLNLKQKDLQETETKQIVLATYAMAAEALDIKSLSFKYGNGLSSHI